MRRDDIQASFGIVPVYFDTDNKARFLVVLHKKGHWGFPKGRAETNEAPLSAALRELGEETGIISCQIIDPAPMRESYTFAENGETINKTVMYFLGRVGDDTLTLQPKEIEDARWVTEDEAEDVITYPESRVVLHTAAEKISKLIS